MKRVLTLCAVVSILALAVIPAFADNAYHLTGRTELTPAETRAWDFVENKMRNADNVIDYMTNPAKNSNTYVLESMGQAMEYLAQIGDSALFARYAAVTDKHFKAPEGYYYWEIVGAKPTGISASLDDFRLFKAYHIANAKGMGNYQAKLQELAADIYKFDVDDHGFPVSYYDSSSKKKADYIDIFYLDTKTMADMAGYDADWKKPLDNARGILLSMPENQFGFYPARYNIKRVSYEADATANMVENLYTAIYAYNAGRNTKPFASFLKTQVADGAIYNHYTDAGNPVKKNGESGAVYALAARFLQMSGDDKSAAWCYDKLLSTQIGVNDKYVGGFSMDSNQSVYAFDQLEALLAMREVKPTAGASDDAASATGAGSGGGCETVDSTLLPVALISLALVLKTRKNR